VRGREEAETLPGRLVEGGDEWGVVAVVPPVQGETTFAALQASDKGRERRTVVNLKRRMLRVERLRVTMATLAQAPSWRWAMERMAARRADVRKAIGKEGGDTLTVRLEGRTDS